LTLPQTDGPQDNLPQEEERSEQFVLEVSEYFERVDVSVSISFLKKIENQNHPTTTVDTKRHPLITGTNSTCQSRSFPY
jgi:hypothetical protein